MAPFSSVALLVLAVAAAMQAASSSDQVTAVDNILPRLLFDDVRREANRIWEWETRTRSDSLRDTKTSTCWMPIDSFGTPRSAVELAISGYLLEKVVQRADRAAGGGSSGSAGFTSSLGGAEYWIQRSSDVRYHYDKDEGAASEEQYMRMPILASVLYLADVGAPTLILNRTTSRSGNAAIPIIPQNGFISYPVSNRLLMFAGTLGHAVPAALSRHHPAGAEPSRLTLLVNWWDKMPRAPYSRPVSDAMMLDMVGRESIIRACAAWEWGRLRRPPYDAPTQRTAPMRTLHIANGQVIESGGEHSAKQLELELYELQPSRTSSDTGNHLFFDFVNPSQLLATDGHSMDDDRSCGNQATTADCRNDKEDALYAVWWGEGHMYGNIDELDLENPVVAHLWQNAHRYPVPMAIVFVEVGHDRSKLERPEVLAVATEWAGRMRIFIASPSHTAGVLESFDLHASDCPTVVVVDAAGVLGMGASVFLPPSELTRRLDAAAMRRFLSSPTEVASGRLVW
jgi:hypothetical protein